MEQIATHVPAARPAWQAIFRNSREWRAGWRLLLYIVVSQVPGRVVVALLQRGGFDADGAWSPTYFMVLEGLSFAVALLGAWVMARLERRTLADYGLAWERPARMFLVGGIWGFAAVGLVVLLVSACGGMHFAGAALPAGPLALAALSWGLACLGIGLAEEFLFRGYALATLATGMRFWPAAILLSLLFGALHFFGKPQESWMDGVSVTLIGLFLCWTLRRTGSLWWAIGFHALFDWAALALFGAPNTGNGGQPIPGHLLATTFVGPDWLTGGVCGLEASVWVFPVLAAVALVFQRSYRSARFPRPAAGT